MKLVVFKLCSLELLWGLPAGKQLGLPFRLPSLLFLQIFTKHQLCAGCWKNNGE